MRRSAIAPFLAAAALTSGACAECVQTIPPPPLPTVTRERDLLTPRDPPPADAPPLRFVGFEATFDEAISTTRYEIFAVDPIALELAHLWRMRFDGAACGDLQWSDPRRAPLRTAANGYVHHGCDVDVVERGAKVEVRVVRRGDLTPSGEIRPGARFLLYVRSARAGDSPETRSWPLDEVISHQTIGGP